MRRTFSIALSLGVAVLLFLSVVTLNASDARPSKSHLHLRGIGGSFGQACTACDWPQTVHRHGQPPDQSPVLLRH